MSNTITLSEPQVDTLMGTWTGLQLERGVSSTNLASFTVVTRLPYVLDQTTYTYIDTTGAPTDWYRVVRYGSAGLGTYSPPWPVTVPSSSGGDGARRSLKACRRMLARKMSSLQVVTTTDDATIDGTSIISTSLANQLDANRYRSWWLMPTDGVSSGQVRIVGENALNPTTGQLNFQPAMISQIVKGTQVELHKLLSPDFLRDALNLALAECWVLDRLALATTGAVSYDIETLGDWLDPEAVYEFYGPAFSGIPLQPFGGYTARRDAEQVDIDVIGLASGATATVELTRPGDTYMKVGGVWLDNQTGFVNDTDESLFQPSFLSQVAKAHCYETLAGEATGVRRNEFRQMADAARGAANVLKYAYLPHPAERSHGGYTVSSNDWLSWIR